MAVLGSKLVVNQLFLEHNVKLARWEYNVGSMENAVGGKR